VVTSRETSKALSYVSHTQFYLQTTPLPRKRSPDGATTGGRIHLIAAYYSFVDPEMKG